MQEAYNFDPADSALHHYDNAELRAFREAGLSQQASLRQAAASMKAGSSCLLKRGLLASMVLLLDVLAVMTGFLLAHALHSGQLFTSYALSMVSPLVPLFLAFSIKNRTVGQQSLERPSHGIFSAVEALGYTMLALLLFAYFTKTYDLTSRYVVVMGTGLSVVLLVAFRLFVVGPVAGRSNCRFARELLLIDDQSLPSEGWSHVVHAVDIGLSPYANDPEVLAETGWLLEDFDRVVVSASPARRMAWIRTLSGAGIDVEILTPELDLIHPKRVRQTRVGASILVSPRPLSMGQAAIKRCFDIVASGCALVLLLPLFGLIAATVRLTSQGPAFFRQPRVGYGNRMFNVYKFRTMKIDACDPHASQLTAKDDDRVTPVGNFLRRTSLDELPQLINVFLGQMSIVGPRPHALGATVESLTYWNAEPRYWQRAAVKPGITGLAQVRGFRGTTHQHSDLAGRISADLEYLTDWSIWKDLKIIVLTFFVLVHPNAY